MSGDETRPIARQIYDRYARTDPPGTAWRLRPRWSIDETNVQGSCEFYDLCRANWVGGVYFSPDKAQIEALAECLNQLDGLTPESGGGRAP
jgi:hypothetical protein